MRHLAFLLLLVGACGGGAGGGSADGATSRDGAVLADHASVGDGAALPTDGALEGTVPEGGACGRTAQCMAGLYCTESGRTCEPSGTGGDGTPCGSSADCGRALVCVFDAGNFLCRPSQTADVGERCLRQDQCQAGLLCEELACTEGSPGGGGDGGTVLGRPCNPGESCDDGSACTFDSCVDDRCVHALFDLDEDGFASTVYGSCGLDCNDEDPTVNPLHEQYEESPHRSDLTGNSFDWNCNGRDEPDAPDVSDCDPDLPTSGTGYLTVPTCGEPASYGECVNGRAEVREVGRIVRCR